jgi:hypothetical protein
MQSSTKSLSSIPTILSGPSFRSVERQYSDMRQDGDMSVFSFGSAPSIPITWNSYTHYANSRHANEPLPETNTSSSLNDGAIVVGIGAACRSKSALRSHSFGPCTPMAAVYADGTVGLYHAMSAAENDPHRAMLIDKKPTDIFVITKDGVGPHAAKQTAQVIDTVNQAHPDTSVHVVTLPRHVLALEVTPNEISVSPMAFAHQKATIDDNIRIGRVSAQTPVVDHSRGTPEPLNSRSREVSIGR